MRIVVTGGAGFIGANLLRRLLDEPMVSSVVVLDDLSSGTTENLTGLPVDLVCGSILDERLVERVCARADAIVHLAARASVPRSLADPAATHRVNVTGTLNVLEAARHQKCHVVLASSSSVYGSNPVLPKSEDLLPEPLSPYAASKLAGEAYAASYAHSFGLPVLVFRFFNVFGPWQRAGHVYAAVIPAFLERALAGEPVTIYGDGQQTRDFTFVGSLVEVLTAAITRQSTSIKPVNLAFGSRRRLLDVVAAMETMLATPIAVDYAPARRGDVPHSQAASERLAALFPDLHPVDFAEGLRRTVDWWRRTSAQSVTTEVDAASAGLTS